MSQLTSENMAYIHRKLKSRGVGHIDLRYELADHIATAIEEKMEKDISFQTAFDEVMETFGRCGISKLQQEKTKKLRKQSRIIVWHYIKSYFNLPKIVMTIFIVLGYSYLYNLNNNFEQYFYIFCICFIALMISQVIFLTIKYRKRRFSQMEPVNYILGFMGFLPANMINFIQLLSFNPLICIVISSIFTLVLVVAFEMYRDINEELTTRYRYMFQ